MDIILYQINSEYERLNKTLSSGLTLTGTLRGESSIINPSFIIETQNPSSYNYCYIQDFNRYYFITNITSVRNGLWRINCEVDVLMSFKSGIENLEVIVSDATSDFYNYMLGEQWQSSVKSKTDIINFPNGLLDDGEYILITSGGIAT